MTNEEAKQAFFDRVPVMHNGIKYDHITAIFYSYDTNGKLIVSAQMLDACKKQCNDRKGCVNRKSTVESEKRV